MPNTTIQDLCVHLIEQDEWLEVWGVCDSLPVRGLDHANKFMWSIFPPDIVSELLEGRRLEGSFVLKGAISPDLTMIMWSEYLQGMTYVEESVIDFLQFMHCDNILRETGSELTDIETLILASIRPAHFFEDVAHFFLIMGVPPMPLKTESRKLWTPLPRKSTRPIKTSSNSSSSWKI